MAQSSPADGPQQLFWPTLITRQGDGYVVRPGKPTAWLTPREFARQVGLSQKGIYAHLRTDALPERFLDFVGRRRYRISVEALEHWKSYWLSQRGLGAKGA